MLGKNWTEKIYIENLTFYFSLIWSLKQCISVPYLVAMATNIKYTIQHLLTALCFPQTANIMISKTNVLKLLRNCSGQWTYCLKSWEHSLWCSSHQISFPCGLRIPVFLCEWPQEFPIHAFHHFLANTSCT